MGAATRETIGGGAPADHHHHRYDEESPLVGAGAGPLTVGSAATMDDAVSALGNERGAVGGMVVGNGDDENDNIETQHPQQQQRSQHSSSHHRRESSIGSMFLDAIHEGVAYVEETIDVVIENVGEGVHTFLSETVPEHVQTVSDAVSENVQEFQSNVVEEAGLVVEAVMEDLTHADDGDNYFLDMSLARNLSILPTDMVRISEVHQDLAILATDEQPSLPPQQHQPNDARIDDIKDDDWTDDGSSSTDTERAVSPTESTPLKCAAALPENTGDEKNRIATAQQPPAPHRGIAAYCLLASAVVALSSVGPILDMQQGCTPILKIFWRMSATAMMLFPFAVNQISKEGFPTFSCPQLTTMILCGICYSSMGTFFSLSVEYTVVGNAVILSNSQSIMLLVAKFLVGDPVTLLEASGALTAFLGAFLCCKESSTRGEAGGSGSDNASVFAQQNLSLLGDLFGLLSGMSGCGYMIFAKRARTHIGLYVFMFLNMLIGCTWISFVMIVVLGDHVTFDRNENHGLFGWMNLTMDRFPLEIVMVGVCNMLGALGYVRAMQYFDNLVISVAALMEPVVAEVLALLLGVGTLPGFMGWAGNALVAAGTFCVIAPSNLSGRKGASSGH